MHAPTCFSLVQLFATLWIVACQAPLSMGVFRQEYQSGLPLPPSGDLPDPGMDPASLVPPALAPPGPPGKPIRLCKEEQFHIKGWGTLSLKTQF